MTSVRRRWPRILAAVVAAAVVLTAIVGGGLTLFMGRLAGNITAIDVSEQLGSSTAPSAPVVIDEETGNYEPFTVLLMGSDTRSGKGNKGYGSASEISGERSDTTILMHVNADRTRAVAVSIPRDTLITLPKCKRDGKTVGGYEGKFNEAFDIGGPGCTMKAVAEMTGLDLQHFMMVDFGGFKRIVNAIGGVEICLAEDVNDDKSGLNLSKGKHVVTGEEALAFVRARKTLGDGSDTSRIRRQQAFISSMAKQVLSAGTLLNPAALVSVLSAATESLSADPALADVNNLKDLALSMKDLRPSDITFVTMPWKPAGDRVNVLVNEKKAQVLWDAIANDTPYPPKRDPDAPVLKTEPSGVYVNVLNGTDKKGAAKKAARQLRKAGFRVMEIGNVEEGQVYEKTTVIFDPKWDVSARTLVYAANAVGQSERKHGQRMDLIIGEDFDGLQEVEIDEIASDVYTNLNTADENFCAS